MHKPELDLKLLQVFAAVHAAKSVSRAADRLGLADRGRIAPGYKADLVVFDAARIADTASYAYPWDETQMPTIFRSEGGLHGYYSLITDYGCGITPGDRQSWMTPYTYDPHAPSTLFLGTYRMYRSKDRGTHWTQVGPEDMCGGNDYILCVSVSRTDGRWVYAGTTNGRVWRSSCSSACWTGGG